MLRKWQFWVLMAISLAAGALVIVNMVLFTHNRGQQQKATARQQFIQQSVQLEALYQQLVKGLAELAARNNDPQLTALLNAQGITFSRNTAPAASAPSPVATPVRK